MKSCRNIWMGAWAALLLCSPLPGLAAVVWQYEGAGVSSNAWVAAREGGTLTALHGASNGWSFAEVRHIGARRAAGFEEGASAFAFPPGATNRVAALYAVVRSETPEAMATLIEAPKNVCVRLEASPLRPLRWQPEQLGYRADHRVNGIETGRFEASANFQLVEAHFETWPVMRELYVGNAAASPLWQRHWRGEIGELLFFTRAPTEPEQQAVYHYLRLKWGVPLAYDTRGTNVAATLDGLGIRRGALFGSLFLVR